MANRFSIGDVQSLYKGLTLVRAHVLMDGSTPILQKWAYPAVNSGSSGSYGTAPSSGSGGGGFGPSAGAEGVKSITRTGAGLWTVVLQDNYNRLLDMSVFQSLAGGVATIIAVGENTTLTSMTAAGGSAIGVALMSAGSGAAVPAVADPATTTRITLTFLLQNSTAP